ARGADGVLGPAGRGEGAWKKGAEISAAIARTQREKGGKISLVLRAKESSPLRQLRFEARGPRATISGSPCFDQPTEYARFPEYEIFSREILGGRRCAQVMKPETAAPVPEK